MPTTWPLVSGALQKEAYTTGDWNKGILSVGQSAAFATAVQPVEDIIDQLLDRPVAGRGRGGGIGSLYARLNNVARGKGGGP